MQNTIIIEDTWVKQAVPRRSRSAHKGDFGRLLVLAGSRRYRGAAQLAVAGALRSGAGIVCLAAIEPVCAAAAAQLSTCTFLPLPESEQGDVAAQALQTLLDAKASAVLAGCGLGATADAAALVRGLLAAQGGPLVLDADALNVLAGCMEEGQDDALRNEMRAALGAASRPVVLTPHPGEMARLCGKPIGEVLAAPAQTAADFAMAHDCVVVLKSHATVVAVPKGEGYQLCADGNPGLAKGGSGDMLAGVIAGLAAQGMAPVQAAAAGVWLHAEAAKLATAQYGEAGMSPADLPLFLGQVWARIGR